MSNGTQIDLLRLLMLNILVIAIPVGLLTLLRRFLLSRYWLSRIRPYLTIGLTTIALIAVLYLNLFSFGFAYLWRFDPIISDCGCFGVAECPSTSPSQWELKANNYYAWMLTPPPLRPACDWVSDMLCERMQTDNFVGSWGEYIFLLGSVLGAALLTGLGVNSLLNLRAGNQKLATD